jgi:hypothetical protein
LAEHSVCIHGSQRIVGLACPRQPLQHNRGTHSSFVCSYTKWTRWTSCTFGRGIKYCVQQCSGSADHSCSDTPRWSSVTLAISFTLQAKWFSDISLCSHASCLEWILGAFRCRFHSWWFLPYFLIIQLHTSTFAGGNSTWSVASICIFAKRGHASVCVVRHLRPVKYLSFATPRVYLPSGLASHGSTTVAAHPCTSPLVKSCPITSTQQAGPGDVLHHSGNDVTGLVTGHTRSTWRQTTWAWKNEPAPCAPLTACLACPWHVNLIPALHSAPSMGLRHPSLRDCLPSWCFLSLTATVREHASSPCSAWDHCAQRLGDLHEFHQLCSLMRLSCDAVPLDSSLSMFQNASQFPLCFIKFHLERFSPNKACCGGVLTCFLIELPVSARICCRGLLA